MRNLRIARRYLGALALACVVPTMAGQCGDVTSPPHTVNYCATTLDPDFPTNGSLNLNKPSSCPFATLGNESIPYAAVVMLPSGSVNYGAFQAIETDFNGNVQAFVPSVVWNDQNGNYVVDVSGYYEAAAGGFDASNSGYDKIQNQLYVSSHWTSGTVTLGYTYGSPGANVAGPSGGVGSGVQYSLFAKTSDPNMVSPATWTWAINGSQAGTTSSGEFTWYGGDPGTYDAVTVTVTDANNVSHTATTNVMICSDQQIQC